LKPLFSFAGQGVIIDLTADDLKKIKDPENWILQRKVKYADVIETPDIPAKVEIRIFYFWKDGEARPVPTSNLARLQQGKDDRCQVQQRQGMGRWKFLLV
jgi:hypothetical protein